MKNTTTKNHKILLKFLEENSDSLRLEQCNFESILPKGEKISKADMYWMTVKQNSFSMKELFDYYMPKEDVDFLIDDENIEELTKIFDFRIKYFQECTREENGFVFIGDDLPLKLNRIPKKLVNNNVGYIFDKPFLDSDETDYETAIELVRIKCYVIPSYKCIKLNQNMILISRGDNSRDHGFMKKTSSYVGYGTHWM